jgi:hypothetical protein
MDPISLHLTDRETKPVHEHPYTVPRSVDQQLRTAYGGDIEVLEEGYTSEWVSPTFAITIAKKNGTTRVVSDFSFSKATSIPDYNVIHFRYQRLGTYSNLWRGSPLLQHWI